MKQYALREKLRHYSSSALCGPGGGSTAPLGATSILEDIGNIGILDGGTEVFFFLVFLLFFFLLFFFFFFSVPPDFAENASSEVEIASDLTPSGGSSIFLEYLFRVSFSSIFFYERTGRPEVFFFLLFTNPNRRRHGDRTLSGPFIDTWGTSPWKKSILTNRFLRRKGRGGGVWHGNSGADDFTIGFATENGGVCFYFGSFFFFKSFFMLRGRRFSFVFIVSFASSSSFRPFSFSYRRGSRFESLGGCFLFFF